MSTLRPTVAAELVASMIESTPDRVRRRLDQSPQAAASWQWLATEVAWSIDTGGETVTLPTGHVALVEHVRCTCLLSPRCFHVLACLTSLEVAVATAELEAATEPDDAAVERDDMLEPGETQRIAARELVQAVAQLLVVGAANAGVVVQSGLLRAVHQCRAEGLHRLASLGLRTVTGVTQLRARARSSDPAQLADDVAAVLENAHHVVNDSSVESFWIGIARRAQRPVRPRKLHGLLAEPILTRSGFAGAAVYFLGEDGQIYSASDVRPADVQNAAQMARDAYRGGIEIGSLVQPARHLARGLYLVSEMTASADGRLGRGKGVRIVEHGTSNWQADAIRARFQRPLTEQRDVVLEAAPRPADAQPAGWDLVFCEGTVLGAIGPELLLQTPDEVLRLAIADENPSLQFRENLRMLSHAAGLKLQIIARLNPVEPDVVLPLALAMPPGEQTAGEPYLALPEPYGGLVCLGFDEIQSKHLVHRQESPTVLADALGFASCPRPMNDPLEPLRRRWVATMLAGFASQRHRRMTSLAAECSALVRDGFTTAAELLDALAKDASKEVRGQTFLAAAIYLRTCRFERLRRHDR